MIIAPDVMSAWRQALAAVRDEGRRFVDDENRECCEMLNMTIKVESLQDVKQALQWLRANNDWLYPSNEELQDVLFTRSSQEDRYSYGPRIFSFRGQLDQIEGHIIPLLRDRPESRRGLVVIADPIADNVTISHNFVSMLSLWFRIIDEKLHVTATVRSNDLLIGWPANVYQISLLLTYVAEKLGIQVGTMTTISLSAHYFGDDGQLVEKILGRAK